MANHKSAKKRIRQNSKLRVANRYKAVSTRKAIRKFNDAEKVEATEMLPKISSMIDKLAKSNIIHNNKAANIKSKLTKRLAAL